MQPGGHITFCKRVRYTSLIRSGQSSSLLCVGPPVCYWCGGQGENTGKTMTSTVEAQFKTVCTVCFLCKPRGKNSFTRHPLDATKQPRKSQLFLSYIMFYCAILLWFMLSVLCN